MTGVIQIQLSCQEGYANQDKGLRKSCYDEFIESTSLCLVQPVTQQ